MDVPTRPADSDLGKSCSTTTDLFERTISSVLMLLALSVRTTTLMLHSPRRFAALLRDEPACVAPPYSFLLTSLLIVGICVRSAVSFYERRIDHTLLSRLTTTLESITLEGVFVLTIPCIVLVAMAGAGLSRAVRPGVSFSESIIVRAVCYTAALQFTLVTVVCFALLILKLSYNAATITSESSFDKTVFTSIATLIFMSSIPLSYVVRQEGQSRWVKNRFTAMFLSGVCSTTILVGVAIANSVSFDLKSTIADVRQRYQRETLGDVKVAVRTLNSRMVQDELGRTVIEMTIAMVNVSDKTLMVPRPFTLEHAFDPLLPPIKVIASSTDLAEQSGWIIPSGQTELIRWMLDVPGWCKELKHQQAALPIQFSCFPLCGTDDLFNQHPVGEASPVLGELSWPMYEAWRSGDQRSISRIAAMMDGKIIR